MHADGSFVVTKHPGTGGLVSVGTVTAQLLYEIAGPEYANPDVVARFDTIRLDAGRARPRARLGRARRAAAADAEGLHQLPRRLPELDDASCSPASTSRRRRRWSSGRCSGASAATRALRASSHVQLDAHRPARPATATSAATRAPAHHGEGPRRAEGRPRVLATRSSRWRSRATRASSPRRRPATRAPYGVYWPALVPAREVHEQARAARRARRSRSRRREPRRRAPRRESRRRDRFPAPPGGADARARRSASLCGARSGDKGGNANVGVWARTTRGYAWLERLPHGRAPAGAAAGGGRARGAPLRAPEPARAQLRARRAARRRRRGVAAAATRRRRASASTCARAWWSCPRRC